jgi:hypothetical protein
VPEQPYQVLKDEMRSFQALGRFTVVLPLAHSAEFDERTR